MMEDDDNEKKTFKVETKVRIIGLYMVNILGKEARRVVDMKVNSKDRKFTWRKVLLWEGMGSERQVSWDIGGIMSRINVGK